MKIFHLFLGLCFLISITVSQSADAGSPIPPGLQSAIDHAKMMKRSGASKKDIAAYVTRTVANRVTFLNHNSKKIDSIMGDAKIEKQLKRFDAFWDKGNLASDEFSAAVWVWVNRIGQCNESASTAFHILVMAYESIDEILTVTKGDHRFVILGDVKNIPGIFSADDLRSLDDTYIVDPWDGKSFSTKDLSFFDWFQHGQGNRIDEVSYKYYMIQYKKFLSWCKKNPVEYQKWLHGEKKGEMYAEDKENMELFLEEYRTEIEELKKIKEKIEQDEGIFYYSADENLQSAFDLGKNIKFKEKTIFKVFDIGENLCREAKQLEVKISESSAIQEDGETMINGKINAAKQRADNCKTAEDSAFVKGNYQGARTTFSLMKKIMDANREFLFNMKAKLEQIKKNNDTLSNSGGWQKAKTDYWKYLDLAQNTIDKLGDIPDRKNNLISKTTILKGKIVKSKTYYIDIFPSSATEFDQLINTLDMIKPTDFISKVEMSNLLEKKQKLQNASFYAGRRIKLLTGKPPFVECVSIDKAGEMVKQSEETFFRGLLAIKANERLAAGCNIVASANEPEKSDEKTDSSSTSVTPPSVPTTKVTQEKTVFGGLIIAGPSQVTVGQGVSFVACDGAGDPYTKGSFYWNHSREDLLVLSHSGNPAAGTAFKPGRVTIFVIYEGMKAYIDIEIKAKEKNLFSSSGDEDDDNGDMFSSSGDVDDQLDELADNQFQEKCNELVDQIVWSLNRNDADSAQRYTSQAVAYGCDINTGRVDRVASEIRDREKREQERLEIERQQQLAAEAQQRQLEENRRQAANQQKSMQALQGMLNVFGQMMNNNSHQSSNHKLPSIKDPWPASSATSIPSQGMNNNPWKSSSGSSTQTQSNNKPRGPQCQGHTLTCNMGYGRGWKRALDVNNDGNCDICGRPYKHSGNRVIAVLKKKGIQCSEEK